MADRKYLADIISRCDIPQYLSCAPDGMYRDACLHAVDHMLAERGKFGHIQDKGTLAVAMSRVAVERRNEIVRSRLGLPWLMYANG